MDIFPEIQTKIQKNKTMKTEPTITNGQYYILCGNEEGGGGYNYLRTCGGQHVFVKNAPFDTFETSDEAQLLANELNLKNKGIYNFQVGAF